MRMRIIALALIALLSVAEIAAAQTAAQSGQFPDATRRPRQKPAEAQPAPAQAQIDPEVAQVEQYFNSIRTLQARFVQNNPNGSIVQGTLYVRRPGRMRFEYDAPSKLKIVADGFQVTMWDVATKDFGQWPIGWTAASFLVKESLSLTGDLQVEKTERSDGMLHLTMSQAKKPQEGKVIVRLSENPMSLRGWKEPSPAAMITEPASKRVPVLVTRSNRPSARRASSATSWPR